MNGVPTIRLASVNFSDLNVERLNHASHKNGLVHDILQIRLTKDKDLLYNMDTLDRSGIEAMAVNMTNGKHVYM